MGEQMGRSDSYLAKKHFLDDLRDLNNDGVRFCFILGSGASLSSGIPTGQQMMKEWHSTLSQKTPGEMHSLCERTNVPWKVWERICQEGYSFPSEDYFAFYDLRYGRNPREGKRYLTEQMRKAQPGPGYHLLAKLMSNTRHNVVITTNFDHLTEDSFTLNHLGFPQVLDPNTANEMQVMPLDYPLVAKVHGDAMLNPLNCSRQLKKLAPIWEDKLSALFACYTPIVIGYGGGDRTLMAYMEQSTWLDQVYWCSMREKETDTIERFLTADEKLRSLVPMNNTGPDETKGFDGIMADICSVLMPDGGAKSVTPPAPTPTPKSPAPTPKPSTPTPPRQKPSTRVQKPVPAKLHKPLPVLSRERLVNLYNKDTIETLVFRDTLAGAPEEGVLNLAVSPNQEEVLCWRVGNTLTIAGEGGVAAPKNCVRLFADWKALRTVTGAELLDTSGVTDMSWMFNRCGSLQTLDVSNWNTAKVTDMHGMFHGCGSLQTLDVSNWNTAKVTDMHGMFHGCGSLQTLDVSNWNTAQVTNMWNMFRGCSSLQSLNVSNWNTANVTDMSCMFAGTRWRLNPPLPRK